MLSLRKAALLLLVVGLSSVAFANNLIPNAGFTVAGAAPIGTPVTTCSPSGGALSAAASWFTFIPDANSCVITQILPSTDNLSGATGPNMLAFTTNAGFDGSAGNGVFGVGMALPQNTTGHVDIFVPAGSSGDIGFVVLGCCFDAKTFSFTATTGWNRVSFTNSQGPSGEFGLEIFSGGGGSIAIADPFASAPEPGSLILLAAGLTFTGRKLRRAKL